MVNIFLRKYSYLLFFPSIALLTYLLFKRGLSLTFDSYNFLCGADTFKRFLTLYMCDGSAMILSPPGYSIFLSSFILSPISLHYTYIFTTVFMYGFTLYCWHLIFKEEITDNYIFAFACLQIATGLPLFYIHLFIWSEGLFVFFISTGLLSFYKFKAQNSVYWLILFVTSFALSITVKYIGLIIFVSIALGGLLSNKKTFKGYQYFILGIPLFLFLGLILINNLLADSFTGIRPFLNRDGFEVLQSCSGVIFNWVAPANFFPPIFSTLFILVLSFLSFYFDRSHFKWAITFFAFFLFLFISAWRTDIEYDERLFVPVFPFFMMLVFNLLQDIPRLKPLFYLRNAFFILWTTYAFLRLGKNVIQWTY